MSGSPDLGFFERTSSHFIARHAFLFRVVHVSFESLKVAFVRRQVNLLFANVTFSPTASVFKTVISTRSYLGVWFIDVTAVRALFVREADGFDAETPTLQVVVVALAFEEFAVTECTELRWSSKLTPLQWLFGFDEIGAVSASAGGAPFTIVGMVGHRCDQNHSYSHRRSRIC